MSQRVEGDIWIMFVWIRKLFTCKEGCNIWMDTQLLRRSHDGFRGCA